MAAEPGLTVTEGFTHLPAPRGPHQVGYLEVFTSPRHSLPGLLVRLYYPCTPAPPNPGLWTPWLPAPAYAQGYLRYKFSSLSPLLPLMGHLFTWLTGSPRIPATPGSPVLPSASPLPVLVFSHGLAACRTSYSFLATDLASQGMVVACLEHGDGSACAREVQETEGGEVRWRDQVLGPEVETYQERNRQVKERAQEAGDCLTLLDKINRGDVDSCSAWVGGGQGREKLVELEGRLDMDRACLVGHSFGGATTVLALATDNRFKLGVGLDSWLFPLKDEKLEVSTSKMLFVNCEKFQGATNLGRMKRFEGAAGKMGSNVLTLKQASHYAPTDIPLVLEGSATLSRILGMAGTGATPSSYSYLSLISDLVQAWLSQTQGGGEAMLDCIESNRDVILEGIEI